MGEPPHQTPPEFDCYASMRLPRSLSLLTCAFADDVIVSAGGPSRKVSETNGFEDGSDGIVADGAADDNSDSSSMDL